MTSPILSLRSGSVNAQSHFIRMATATTEFPITHATIRRWEKIGLIRCIRTPGGTRLVDRDSLMESLGLQPEK